MRTVEQIANLTGRKEREIYMARYVQKYCIPEIQELCLLGYFQIGQQWFDLSDWPKEAQQQIAKSENPMAKYDEFKPIMGKDHQYRKTDPTWHGNLP